MDKKTYFSILAIFIILSAINFLSAAPLFQSSEGDLTYQVFVPPFSTIKQNADFDFFAHVYNKSDGVEISNTLASCSIHIYNVEGSHILESLMIPEASVGSTNEFTLRIDKGNFTTIGAYAYVVYCNSSTNRAGAASDGFKVTFTGYEANISQSLSIAFGFLILIFIALILFIFGLYAKMPIKLFVLGISLMIIVFTIGYVLNLSEINLGEFSNITSLFNGLYYLAIALLTAAGMGLIIYLISFVLTEFRKTRGMSDED